jgi:carboxylate-amine ligase
MDGELVDQVARDGRRIGSEVFEVACQGGVSLVNAPGNGAADDKSIYSYVPDLIECYLGERTLLESVPTYRTGDEEERAAVLERVGELVTKPVDGEGGRGVLIGPDATAREVAERRERIVREPERWIAQEVVTLSWHPSLVGDQLEPRHVDLRAFVYTVGPGDGRPGDYAVAPAALTRVAAGDSKIVNSSRGGGAKDTWIIGPAGPHPREEPEHVRTGG